MTEEKKTEEYLKCEFACGDYDRENKKCIFKNKCEKYKIYLDGLAEGRKENAELEEELHQKSDTNHSLVEQLADKEIIISELKEQIKKMKCCRNCKHFNQVEIHCDLYAKYECVNLDKWELAE